MSQLEEIWVTIHFTDKYEISNIGRVRDISSGKIKETKQRENRNMVRIKYDDIDKKINVGREMLTCFVRERNRGEYCFYLNGNTLDDRLDNLEWSCKKNVNNAFKGTPIEVKYNDNDQVVRFDSVADAAEELDVKTSEIYDSMRVGVVVHNLNHVTIKYIRENPAENATIKDIYFGNKIINVSSDGFVCVNGTNKWKRGGIQRGYMRTSFQFDKEGVYVVGGKGKQYDIHRLVATAFYDNPLGHTDSLPAVMMAC